MLWRAFDDPRLSSYVGVEHFFPTSSKPILGTEKYTVSRIAALFVPIKQRLFLIPVYQQLISYAGKDSRADLNILPVRAIVMAPLPRSGWVLLDPGFYWDLEDDLKTSDTMTLGLQLGKRISRGISASAKPSIQVYGSEDFSWAMEFGFTINLEDPSPLGSGRASP